MSVDSKHPDWVAMCPVWGKMRDTSAGLVRVAAARTYGVRASGADQWAGEVYLPRLAGQQAKDYAAYRNRAWWYPAVGRTIQGYVGTLFRRDPAIEWGPLAQLEANWDGRGRNFSSWTRDLASEVLTAGRAAVVVDWDPERSAPFAQLYTAEQLVNWHSTFYVFALVRQEVKDYVLSTVEQRHIVRVDGEGWVGELWERQTDETWRLVQEPLTYQARGVEYNPVIVTGWSSMGDEVEYPPLLELADLNLSHYRNSADHENGLHFCGMPQYWISGLRAIEGEVWNIGVPEVWMIGDPGGKAGVAEMSGASVGKLAEAMVEKERRMAAVGARMLEGQRKAVETAETARIRQAGERSALSVVAKTVSETITAVMKRMAAHMGQSEDVGFAISDDFDDTVMSTEDMVRLMQVWQSGGLSQESYLYNLKKGERLVGSVDDEAARISADDVKLMGG